MIWLAPMAGTEEGSVYFEIRDIALQPDNSRVEAVVSGLLGDGQREIWTEVQLGSQPSVSLLPLWTEDGQIEALSAEIDEELLESQLIEALQRLFSTIAAWPMMFRDNQAAFNRELSPELNHWLAA